jgi:sugar lactone lactonase YvrE
MKTLMLFAPLQRLFALLPLAASLALAPNISQATQPEAKLSVWRSYSGVTWDTAANPVPYAASATTPGAPIAGLHFAADGSAFVSTPRLVSASAPATLSRLDTTVTSGPARLTAFPSVEGNNTAANPAEHLRNVLGFYIDKRNGWLWALDMGFVAGEATAPAGAQKLVVLALDTGRVVKSIALDGVSDRAGSFLNDVVVDEARRVAYISDSGLRSAPHNMVGLVVVDFASSQARRVLDKHPSLAPEADVKVVSHGQEVWPGNPLVLGINGIALSPDGATLYWTVTTGTRLWSMPTALLRDPKSNDVQLAASIRNLGAVGGNTDGITTDAKGRVYITDVTRNGIVRYDPAAKTMRLIASDDGVHWPDTPAIAPDGALVFTASALNDHFAGAVKPGQKRYQLWRLQPKQP